MKIAFLFAGQGAQYSGMGQSIYNCSDSAKEVFSACEKLRSDIKNLCFFGSDEELKQTVNTQAAVYCVDMACAYALYEKGVKPDCVAGFSLGEIPALCFAGAYSLGTGFEIVIKRAELMQKCCDDYPGAMVAVLKLDEQKVLELCEKHDVYAANFNSKNQIVVSGKCENIDDFIGGVKLEGGRAVKLNVSGAFHSPMMQTASKQFGEFLQTKQLNLPGIPVYSNVTARPYSSFSVLSEQIQKSVLFEKTILNMKSDGVDTFIEVGPGKVLSGLVSKIIPDAKILNVCDEESLSICLESLNIG